MFRNALRVYLLSYSIYIENDHVYVKDSDVVDTLDIVILTKDNLFISHIRILGNIIHDFSLSVDSHRDLRRYERCSLMANIESNVTENLVDVIIPRKIDDQEQRNN